MGLFTLLACSDETYQEAEEINSSVEENSDTSGAGGNAPFTAVSGYISPWHIGALPSVNYYHYNYHDYYVRITPYIGLAYYDGANDGVYVTPTGSHNFASPNYPNLYNGGKEYGNYIAANPIVLSERYSTHEVYMSSTTNEHCPITNALFSGYNGYQIFFDINPTPPAPPFISGNRVVQPYAQPNHLIPSDNLGTVSPPPPAATPAERQLLADYGKVMYYKIEFGTAPATYTQTVYSVLVEANNVSSNPNWATVPVLPDFLGGELYYSTSGSREIVIDATNLYPNNLSVKRQFSPFTLPGFGDVEIRTFYDHIEERVWLQVY